MIIRRDLWISGLASKKAFNEIKTSQTWIPQAGNLRINIACHDHNAIDIDNIVNVVHKIRVGNEAHYPMVNIWLQRPLINEAILNTLSALDKYIPRIRLIIIDVLEDDINKISDILHQTSLLYLHTNVLLISYGYQSFDFKIYRNLIDHLYFEWFSNDPELDSWKQCYAMTRQLNKIGYNFSKHPLMLCGGISFMQKAFMLSQFNINATSCSKDISSTFADLGQLKSLFNTLQDPCALGAIKYILRQSSFIKELKCTCATTPTCLSVATYRELAKTAISKNDDSILYEDWEYIYDGFDLV